MSGTIASNRRLTLRGILLGALLLSAGPALAQGWPTKPVRILVPYSVGLGPDVVLRTVAEWLSKQWRQPVIVDNRPGGSGVVALSDVRRTPPDGHTLFLGDAGSLAMNPYLYRSLPYDPQRDFVPISTIFRATFIVWTKSPGRINSIQDVLRLARAKPGAVTYASLGNAHPSQTAMETFAARAGIVLLHVPFKDGAQMLGAVANGDVDLTALSWNSAAGMAQSGRIRALAVGHVRRLVDHPEIPTLAEVGAPPVEMTPWAGLLGVTGTPRAIVEQIERDVHAALADPGVRGKIEGLGFLVTASTPEELWALVKQEAESFGQLVRSGRVRAD